MRSQLRSPWRSRSLRPRQIVQKTLTPASSRHRSCWMRCRRRILRAVFPGSIASIRPAGTPAQTRPRAPLLRTCLPLHALLRSALHHPRRRRLHPLASRYVHFPRRPLGAPAAPAIQRPRVLRVQPAEVLPCDQGAGGAGAGWRHRAVRRAAQDFARGSVMESALAPRCAVA